MHTRSVLCWIGRRVWRSTLFPYTTLFRSEYRADMDIRDHVWTRKAVLPHAPDAKVADIQIGRAHVWNSSHVEISYAVFCLKKKSGRAPLSQAAAWERPINEQRWQRRAIPP